MIDRCLTDGRGKLAAIGSEVERIEGDMRSYASTYAASYGVDCAIRLAAPQSVSRSLQDLRTTTEFSATGKLNVMLGARVAGA